MDREPRRSAVEATAESLRQLALSVAEGSRLGNEESLLGELPASRNTIRQAARLVEREGLIRVKTGVGGGYFAARPDLRTVEAAVGAYLKSIAVTVKDVTYVASLLWEEAVRRAALLPRAGRGEALAGLLARVEALAPDADFAAIVALESEIRTAVFALADSAYIEMIFQINHAFASRGGGGEGLAVPPADPEFAARWRKGKLMELGAIIDGDASLAAIAAHHSRNIWHERFWTDAAP